MNIRLALHVSIFHQLFVILIEFLKCWLSRCFSYDISKTKKNRHWLYVLSHEAS